VKFEQVENATRYTISMSLFASQTSYEGDAHLQGVDAEWLIGWGDIRGSMQNGSLEGREGDV
jgi:hypothetical protein